MTETIPLRSPYPEGVKTRVNWGLIWALVANTAFWAWLISLIIRS